MRNAAFLVCSEIDHLTREKNESLVFWRKSRWSKRPMCLEWPIHWAGKNFKCCHQPGCRIWGFNLLKCNLSEVSPHPGRNSISIWSGVRPIQAGQLTHYFLSFWNGSEFKINKQYVYAHVMITVYDQYAKAIKWEHQ